TEAAQTRLVREAQTMARLSHANVVSVFDVGNVEGQLYIAMEYVDGVALGTWLSQAKRPWREGLRVLLAAGGGPAGAPPGGGPRGGARASRRQARQHPSWQERPRQDDRLRRGSIRGPR